MYVALDCKIVSNFLLDINYRIFTRIWDQLWSGQSGSECISLLIMMATWRILLWRWDDAVKISCDSIITLSIQNEDYCTKESAALFQAALDLGYEIFDPYTWPLKKMQGCNNKGRVHLLSLIPDCNFLSFSLKVKFFFAKMHFSGHIGVKKKIILILVKI